MQVHGLGKVLAGLRTVAERYPRAAAAALYQEGFGVWREAVKRAPVLYGVLRSSAYVTPPQGRGVDAVVEVGFGTKYARRQHEETGWKHPRGGQAKYLFNALQALRSGMLQRMAERIKANAGRGVGIPVLPAPTVPALGWAGLANLKRSQLPKAAIARAGSRPGRSRRRRRR